MNMLAFSVDSVMIVPLWSLIAGITVSFAPFHIFVELRPAFRSTDRKNVACAVFWLPAIF
jgi:hypothetical protein